MITQSQYIALIMFAVLGIAIPCILPVLIHKKDMRIQLIPLPVIN